MKRLEKIASEFGNDFAGFLNYSLGTVPFKTRNGAAWGVGIAADTHIFELWLDPDNDGLGYHVRVWHEGGGYTIKTVLGTYKPAPTQWVSTADHAVLILTSFVGLPAYESDKKKWAAMSEACKEFYFTF